MAGLPKEEFDVVVLGTGAAGFTAAVVAYEFGASVAIFEKASLVGGTTAWSGGQVWIPNNPHMPESPCDPEESQCTTLPRSGSHCDTHLLPS